MTFEETITFYNPEHADEFILKLKKSGFKTKSRRINTLVKETICTGRIDDFISLFDGERQKYEDNGDKTEVQALISDMYIEIIDELRTRRGLLKEFFEFAKPGDCLSDISGFEDFSADKISDESIEEDEDDITDKTKIFHLLNENELLNEIEGRWFLKEIIEPGDVITAVPSEMMLEASSPEKRAEYNINTIINVMSGLETQITLPPEFAIVAESGIIDEIMEKYDVDEESVWRLKENNYIKSLLAEKIIEFLKETERSSFEDIFGEMKNFSFKVDDTNDEFRFDLDEKFLKEMLGDMKRMDIIKSKGNRYKSS